MFNNAGIAIGGNVDSYGIDDWRYMLDVKLYGVVNGVQAAYRAMLDQGFGHIVNTASIAGLSVCPGMVSYAAAKFAVVGLSKALRAEAASVGVRVSDICSGVIRTPILEGGKYGRMLEDIKPEKIGQIWEKMRQMAPDLFAKKTIATIAANKAVIIVPSWWRIIWWTNRLSPSLAIFLARRSFQSMRKELTEC